MMNSCIGTLGVIRKELAILKPATVILYTGKDYDNWIPRLMWASRQKWRSLTNEAHEVDCDGVRLRWWEGELTGGPTHVRVLRVGHPQGKPVDAYVRMLSDWIGNPGVGAQKSAEEEISL
jgi:hypothetical protein